MATDRTICTGETVRWADKSAPIHAEVEIMNENNVPVLDWLRNGPITGGYAFNAPGTYTWSRINTYSGHVHWTVNDTAKGAITVAERLAKRPVIFHFATRASDGISSNHINITIARAKTHNPGPLNVAVYWNRPDCVIQNGTVWTQGWWRWWYTTYS